MAHDPVRPEPFGRRSFPVRTKPPRSSYVRPAKRAWRRGEAQAVIAIGEHVLAVQKSDFQKNEVFRVVACRVCALAPVGLQLHGSLRLHSAAVVKQFYDSLQRALYEPYTLLQS